MRAFSTGDRLAIADVTGAPADAVRSLGFVQEGAVYARRFDGVTPAIAAHFEQHAERIVRQLLRQEPVPWEAALETLLNEGGDWTLVGSAARALAGEDVSPRDIDVVATTAECERLAGALAELLIEPLSDGGHLGERWFRAFAGARIECVGGPAFDVVELGVVAWHGRDVRTGRVA